jgi:D-sedoheptulose 7-phosphate isomerase
MASLPDAFGALARLLGTVAERHAAAIDRYADLVAGTLARGGRLYFAGNGGSAANAQHCAAEYVVRYVTPRGALPAMALGTNPALLTAASNDLGYEQAFAREVEAVVTEQDLLILHSTSGRSRNLLEAARAAQSMGAKVVALLGRDGGPLRELADLTIVIEHDDTGRIQLVHMAIEHYVVGVVEDRMSGGGRRQGGNGERGTGNG